MTGETENDESVWSGIKEPWKLEIWEEITTEVNNVLLVIHLLISSHFLLTSNVQLLVNRNV